jgi:hypothetical protein
LKKLPKNTSKQIDIVIVNVPGCFSKSPFAAPALLKSSVENAGFSCHTIDFSIKLDKEDFNSKDLENYFATGLNTELKDLASDVMQKYAEEIISYNPKYVGISVFPIKIE